MVWAEVPYAKAYTSYVCSEDATPDAGERIRPEGQYGKMRKLIIQFEMTFITFY